MWLVDWIFALTCSRTSDMLRWSRVCVTNQRLWLQQLIEKFWIAGLYWWPFFCNLATTLARIALKMKSWVTPQQKPLHTLTLLEPKRLPVSNNSSAVFKKKERGKKDVRSENTNNTFRVFSSSSVKCFEWSERCYRKGDNLSNQMILTL